MSGSGIIARAKFSSSTSITANQIVVFSLSNLTATNSQGSSISLTAATLTVTITAEGKVNVWPGDTNNDGKVDTGDLLPIGLYYNQTGGISPNNPGTSWQAYARQPWSADGNTPKKIFADANGSGSIDMSDVLAIGINYAKTHGTSNSLYDANLTKSGTSLKKVVLSNASLKVITPTTVKSNTNFSVQISIGDPVAITDLYGLSFRIVSSSPTCNYIDNSAQEGNFLGSNILKFFQKIDNQTVDVAVSKTSVPGESGTGIIATFSFNSSVDQSVIFNISNVSVMNSSGNSIPLDIIPGNLLVAVKNVKGTPNNFALEQNYPNPFNPTTKIRFDLPKESFVTLKILNSLGEEIKTLVNENKHAGTYEVNFDGFNLSSGIYFYRLQAGSFTQTRKLILIK